MTYPITEADASGHLVTGDGHEIWWETSGNPDGVPAVVLHGGPGSGFGPGWRRYLDPERYRVIGLDQRGCGRSRPLASEPGADLSTVTTPHLVADLEALREHLGVEDWLLLGASWGSTLALAYAVEHPERVRALVLWAVVTTRRRDVEWLTRSMGEVYPEAYDELLAAVPAPERDDVVTAIHRRTMSPDAEVADAAARAWCAWEDRIATLSGPPEHDPRYDDPAFRLGFARLVTWFFGNAAFLPDDGIVGRLDRLAETPAVLVRGRLDIASPLRSAYEVAERLPLAELHVVEGEAHGAAEETRRLVVAATDRFAGPRA